MPDRIYSIQYNGRIYDVRAAETVDPSTLFAFVQQQAGGGPKPEEDKNLLEKVPVVGGALASAADLPLNLISGAAGTAKTVTDVFGANNVASSALNTISNYAQELTSAQSRQDARTAAAIRREAEGKGIWEEVKAAARSFAVNPLDTAASVVGSAIPFAAATLGGTPAALALGAVSGVGTIKGSVSDAVYQRAREAGVPEKQAKIMADEAQSYGGENLDMQALGGVLGAVASATGFDKELGRIIATRVFKDIAENQVERGLVRRTISEFGKEAIPEGAQAGQERFSQNIAQQRAGYPTDLTAGVAGQAAFEGLAGGILGGVTGAVEGRSPRPAPTEEEVTSERTQIEEAITNTGIPEAQDPAIRARAAEIIQNTGGAVGPADAVEMAVAAQQEEEARVTQPDTGGGEPSVPVSDGGLGEGVAAEPAQPDLGGLGTAGVPTGQAAVREGAVQGPLEAAPVEEAAPVQEAPAPVVEPAKPVKQPTMTQRFQSAMQTVADTVAENPELETIPKDALPAVGRKIAQAEARGETVDPLAMLQALVPEKKVAETPEQNIPAPTPVAEEPAVEEAPAEKAPPTVAETLTEEKVAQPVTPQVEPVPVPEQAADDVKAAQEYVNQVNPGYEVRVNPKEGVARPYSIGVPGVKKQLATYRSLDALQKGVMRLEMLAPKKEVEGVAVRQFPAGEAKGIKTEAKPQRMLQPEPPSQAGKLTPAQVEQQALVLYEIDEARRARQISNNERTELVNMLRTPQGKDLARSAEWTLANSIQQEIDKLTREGTQLRNEEKIAKEQAAKDEKPLTPEKKKEFAKRAKDIAKRTKFQSDRLAKAKSGIYQRTREKLAAYKKTRADRLAQAKRNFDKGLIDETTYKRIVRETRPEPIMFRRGREKAVGITLDELNSAVKDITSRWGAKLDPVLVQSVADLPDAVRKEMEDLDRTDAFGFYKDGKAYLVAENMNSAEDVAPTLYHEALGHLGLRRLFREGLDDVLNDIYATNTRVRETADKWLAANEDLYAADEDPTARAVEEVLASASENGPIGVSKFDKLMKYIKDFARQHLGLDLKFTDREVRTILGMAHEQALSGEGTVIGSSSMMFNAPEQQQAKATAADAEVDVEDVIAKVATTTNDQMDAESFSKGMLGDIGDLLTGKSLKNWLNGLKSPNVSGGFIGRGGLNILPTDGFLDYADSKISEPAARELRKAADTMDKLNGSRASNRRVLAKMVNDLKGYLYSSKDSMMSDGQRKKALPLAMDYGNYYNIDMLAFEDNMSEADAYKTDQVWRRYEKLLQKPDLDAKTRAEYQKSLNKRQTEIRGALKIRKNLSPEGLRLYKRIRNMYRDMYQTRRFLIKRYIQGLKDSGMSEESVAKLMKAYQEEYERISDKENAPAKEDAHKDYPEVPLGLFHREYFPKRRYGNYFLRIKKTKFGEPVLRFYEDMKERDADWAAFAQEMGVDKNDQNYFDAGNDVEMQLSENEGVNTNSAFNRALNLIAEINPETVTEASKKKLQKDVYQLFLLASPEGAVRKQFIKSKNRLGWSSDILRTVGATAEEYASDIARLRFGPDIDRAINAAKQAITSEPVNQKLVAKDFISNLERRIQGTMQPQPKGLANKIVPWMNQVAYLSFLTAPATAIVQTTALPIRVAPNLWGKYGFAATSRAMGRYMNVFNNMPKLESTDTSGRKSFRLPTLMESTKIKSSSRHKDALLRATNEYGIIMPLSEFTMGAERTPQTAAAGRKQEVAQKAYDAMTYLFDASEQLTREVAFMSTYDLEYDKLANAGLSPEERQNRAILAAKDTVDYTLGNYSNLNRPPAMKSSELARALFLFKQYSVITTRFFVQNFRAIFGKNTPREERVAAMKEATGVLGMSFLMSGFVGMPLYSLGMMTLQALQNMFDDDEDRKERMRQNPLTADSVEMQFRYEWLPQHFGQPMITTKDGKTITLGDIMLNGAVSEATGWNFGSRVSLDLMGLWFRAPKEGKNWAETANNALVENIPGASASLNIVTMGEEFAKGNVLDGMKAGMPAMFKAWAKAYDYQTEGVRTANDKIKLRKEEISDSELVGAYLGFNPTKIAKLQQTNRDILNRVKDLQEQKSELLSAYKKAVRRIQNGDPDGQEEAKKAFSDIMEYNKKVGNAYFGISYANIYKSLTGAMAEEKYDIQGMGLNQVESAYAEKLLKK